ncbi:pectin lyase [Paenibacillus rigui]|uniref:Pectin lyase n=2 Tax=Paenibacillus rigui TaxID=554312 RepID=A0A229UP75_9BACL|nr:pectin lyase [Paenibacillus rigui]
MIGKIKKLKNNNQEYMYPITVAEAVFTDPEKTLTAKLSELEAGIGSPVSYAIELDRWGIQNNGTDAETTTRGINDALVWAKSAGYNHVVLRGGTYLIQVDPNGTAIYMPSGMHFEMHHDCILQLAGNSFPNYRMIEMKGIRYAKVSGGKMIGDKAFHQYEMAVKFVRGGVNADGSLNDNPQFIRSQVIDRYANTGLLSTFRLWSINGITNTTYSFYQYKDTVSKESFVNFRDNGGFAPAVPSGRGWFDTIDKANKMIFTIDITSSPLTDAQIAGISAKVDNAYYTHESGLGIGILSSNYIEIADMEILDCTGDAILTGIGVYYDDPSQYTQEEMGQHIYIHGCDLHHCRRQGISLCGSNDVYVFNNTIHHIGYMEDSLTSDFRNGTAPMFGIDVESMVSEGNIPYKSIYLNRDGLETNYRIAICNNYIHHNAKGHFVNADGTLVTLQNNTFEGYNVGGISSYPNQWYIQYIHNTFIGCQLVVSGNNVVNGAIFNSANLNLSNVQGAFIENVQIKDGLFNGSSIYGYFGAPAAVDVASGTFTYSAAHGMGNGAQISFEQWYGKVPSGISVDKLYYTVNITSTGFQVSETKGGTPVVITDAGVTGFSIGRYNYGRCYISNVTVERDWKDNNSYDAGSGFHLLMTGGVLNNIMVKNSSLSVKPPAAYVGRPNVLESITLIESTANFESSSISNLKAMRIKTRAAGGDINLGASSVYSRVNVDSGLFQGVQVNLGAAYLSNGTFLNAIIYKAESPTLSTVAHSYMENSSISLRWLTYEKSVILVKNIFNQTAVDVSTAVQLIENIDLNTRLTDNRMSAPPTSGTWALGQIIYNTAPVPGGYAGWICTTGGYASTLAWAASKSYDKGNRINAMGHVYEAMTAGISGTASPAFPTASGASVTDNSITWKELGLLAVFKAFGPISS